jgi:hypothetical protein
VFYLKAVSISDFNFPSDNLTVTLVGKTFKAYKAAPFVHNMVIGFFDSIAFVREIFVHFLEEI